MTLSMHDRLRNRAETDLYNYIGSEELHDNLTVIYHSEGLEAVKYALYRYADNAKIDNREKIDYQSCLSWVYSDFVSK